MASLYQLLSQLPILSSFLFPTPLTILDLPPSNSKPPLCPNPPSLSCPSPPPQDVNTCCVNHPSGYFLQTQFWDTPPPIGPNDSWTIHGLWPDLCTGGFDAFCDSSRSHSDIRTVLRHALQEDRDVEHRGDDDGREHSATMMVDELLSFMETYWLSLDGDHERLWAHEWNKHGTCISTLEPDCYAAPDQSQHRHRHLDVLDYFVHTTSLFRTLDTYAVLAAAGILPSSTRRYTLPELEEAVQASKHGHPVTFRCNRRGELDEVWYHFAVMGSLRHSSYDAPPQDAEAEMRATTMSDPDEYGRDSSVEAHHFGSPFLNASTVRKHFVPVPPDGAISNCPRRGIKYLPKTPDGREPPLPSKTTSVGHPTSSPTSTAAPFTGRGHLEIHILDATSASTPGMAQDPLLASPDSSPVFSSASLKKGCLIRQGQWYASGTCATFRAQHDVVDPGHQALFSLESSYSPCLVNPATGRFECTNSAKVQGIFSYVDNGDGANALAYHNRSVFYAHSIPKRFEKVDLFADDGNGERQVQVEIHWIPA